MHGNISTYLNAAGRPQSYGEQVLGPTLLVGSLPCGNAGLQVVAHSMVAYAPGWWFDVELEDPGHGNGP